MPDFYQTKFIGKTLFWPKPGRTRSFGHDERAGCELTWPGAKGVAGLEIRRRFFAAGTNAR